MTEPDVSIIIPAFDRLWSLPESVESCRSADCSVEVIVVDDGSSDGTWPWLRTQPDVRAIRQENLGKDWAVNRGFAAARAPYVRFVDSDDAVVPGSIDAQLAAARTTGADVVLSGYEYGDAHLVTKFARDYEPTDDFIAQQLGEGDGSHYSAFLFRRAFICDVPHRPEYGARDDRMFVLEVALRSPRLAVCAAPAIRLRHHERERLQFPSGLRESATNYAHLTIYKRVLGTLARRGELTPRRARAACRVLWPLSHWIARRHAEDACEVAAWVTALDPDFRPPEKGALGALYTRLGFRRTERLLRLRRALMSPARQRRHGRLHHFPVTNAYGS